MFSSVNLSHFHLKWKTFCWNVMIFKQFSSVMVNLAGWYERKIQSCPCLICSTHSYQFVVTVYNVPTSQQYTLWFLADWLLHIVTTSNDILTNFTHLKIRGPFYYPSFSSYLFNGPNNILLHYTRAQELASEKHS